MNNLAALLWLKWRLLVNESESRWLFFIALAFLLLLYVAIGVTAGFVLRHPGWLNFSTDQQWLHAFDKILLFVVFFTLLFVVVSPGSLFGGLDTSKLRQYPFTPLMQALFDILIGSLNVWQLGFASFLAGYCLGLGVFFVSATAFVSSSIIIILNVGILQVFVEIFRELIAASKNLSPRVRHGILGVGIAALIYLLSTSDLIHTAIVRWTPPGVLSSALHALLFKHQHTFLLTALLYSLGVFIINFCAFVVIRKAEFAYRAERIPSTLGKSKRQGLILENIFTGFPHHIVALVQKEVLCIYRSKLARRGFLVSFIFLSMMVMQFVLAKIDPEKYFIPFFMFALVIPLVGWETFFNNCFGIDRWSFSFYLFTATPPKHLLISKNIGVVAAMFPTLIPFWAIVAYQFSLAWIPLVILAQSSVLLLLLSFANGISLRHPFPLDPNASVGTISATNYSLYTVLKEAVCAVVALAVVLSLWLFKISWLSYLIVMVFLTATALIYKKTLLSATELFVEQAEKMYLKLRTA